MLEKCARKFSNSILSSQKPIFYSALRKNQKNSAPLWIDQNVGWSGVSEKLWACELCQVLQSDTTKHLSLLEIHPPLLLYNKKWNSPKWPSKSSPFPAHIQTPDWSCVQVFRYGLENGNENFLWKHIGMFFTNFFLTECILKIYLHGFKLGKHTGMVSEKK